MATKPAIITIAKTYHQNGRYQIGDRLHFGDGTDPEIVVAINNIYLVLAKDEDRWTRVCRHLGCEYFDYESSIDGPAMLHTGDCRHKKENRQYLG
jgi:hypothetical protein